MTKIIGGRIPAKEHAKLLVEDKVNDALDRLLFAQLKQKKDIRSDCKFLPKDLGPMWLELNDDAQFFEPLDVNTPELVWPLRFGFVLPNQDDPGSLVTHEVRSVPPKELRGKVRRVNVYNVEWRVGSLSRSSEYIAARMYATWERGCWWHSPTFDEPWGVVRKEVGLKLMMLQSAALTYRYEWGAQFSLPGAPPIILPSTPQGILTLFNDRDKPEDRDRRAALRHWVNSHLRKKRTNEEEFVEVRGHLRGEFDFNWRGFRVRVVPSQFDLERCRK